MNLTAFRPVRVDALPDGRFAVTFATGEVKFMTKEEALLYIGALHAG